MKIWYKALSCVLGTASFLSSIVLPIFVIISLPISNSTTITGFNLKHVIKMLSSRSFSKFLNDLFFNSAYADFVPKFFVAFIFFVVSIVLALLIVLFSITKKKYIYNIVCSGLGVVSLIISSVGVSAISVQAAAGNIDFGKNMLDIFDDFINLSAINCGSAYFMMGLCFLIIFIVSGSLAIAESQKTNNH